MPNIQRPWFNLIHTRISRLFEWMFIWLIKILNKIMKDKSKVTIRWSGLLARVKEKVILDNC